MPADTHGHDGDWLAQLRSALEGGTSAQFILTGNTGGVFPGPDGASTDLTGLLLERALEEFETVFELGADGSWTLHKGTLPALVEGEMGDFTASLDLLREHWRAQAQAGNAAGAVAILRLPPGLAEVGLARLFPEAGDMAVRVAALASPRPYLQHRLFTVLLAGPPGGLHPVLEGSRLATHWRVPYQKAMEPTALPAQPELVGQEDVRERLRQDLQLWLAGDLVAVERFYLLCGPRGVGKRTLVEAAAQTADVPVFVPEDLYRLPRPGCPFDFADWLDQVAANARGIVLLPDVEQLPGFGLAPTEARPEAAARAQQALREFVERDAQQRFLLMATSARPDLLVPWAQLTRGEDTRLPLFPTSHTHEGFRLLQAVLRQGFALELMDADYSAVEENIPWLLTAAEAKLLAAKTYRQVRLNGWPVAKALKRAAREHHSPLENKELERQVRLAIEESDEASFVPDLIRNHFVSG